MSNTILYIDPAGVSEKTHTAIYTFNADDYNYIKDEFPHPKNCDDLVDTIVKYVEINAPKTIIMVHGMDFTPEFIKDRLAKKKETCNVNVHILNPPHVPRRDRPYTSDEYATFVIQDYARMIKSAAGIM